MPKIRVENLKMEYEGEIALENVSFEVQEGEFLSILGPSGCGKSTLLRILIGLLRPTAGTVWKDGADITGAAPSARGMGIVFQNYALFENMTVLGNVEYALRIQKQNRGKAARAKAREKAVDMIRRVNLEAHMDKYPSELSGGQQQRVAIARALVKMPRVLLLDEPLSNLDARLRLQTREEIRRIQKETKITTIFVTHDQEEAMSISDRIVVMKDGVLHQIGKPQEVYDDPVNLFVAKFLGTPPINVFEGYVKNSRLYIGDENIMAVDGVMDQAVYVGIRPEGFILQENGPMTCQLDRVEVMGRDISVISRNNASLNEVIRSIIPTDHKVDITKESINFAVVPHKVFLFNKETEERIHF